MAMTYDIFISYKRKSLPTANNLYYRLTQRGYSTFFDLEEMRRDNFNIQLLSYIENAKDIFILLEEGSLDACKQGKWEDDWFCKEIEHALNAKKNIIPILINGYRMPKQDFFPKELQELSLKNALEFSFSYFDEYLNKLVERGYITSEPQNKNQATSVFKFYSNSICQVFKEGKLVCKIEGMADEPYYLPVSRKGDYRFKCLNTITGETKILKEHIDADEEKDIDIQWDENKQIASDQARLGGEKIVGDIFIVKIGEMRFEMVRIEGGELEIGATNEQERDAERNEFPAHNITISTFYIGKFPVTQNIWEFVMGYNKSHFRYKEDAVDLNIEKPCDIGHYPVENLTYDEAQEFVRRLSKMTNFKFDLPTESEWEYVARGGQKSKHTRFAGSDNINDVAWYRGNSEGSTHPVGEKQPNELGVYDMCGNVWEWTKTPAHSYTTDIVPEGNIFIRRGGSWWHEKKNCRVSHRYASNRSKKTRGLGLRVVIRDNCDD